MGMSRPMEVSSAQAMTYSQPFAPLRMRFETNPVLNLPVL